MFQTFLSSLKTQSSNDRNVSQRRYPRRQSDRCVAVVCGQAFPVEDWSPGGLLISADDRLFGIGKDLDVTVKFKLRNTILDINHRARVIRKGTYKVALAFEPLPQAINRAFQQVVDDYVAREFANSQAF